MWECASALFDGRPADVSSDLLEKQIAKSDIPVLLDIWAPWCGPCRVIGPQFAAAAQASEPDMRFLKLNLDENQEVSARLSIRGIPTMILFKAGREVARISGATASADIIRWAGPAPKPKAEPAPASRIPGHTVRIAGLPQHCVDES